MPKHANNKNRTLLEKKVPIGQNVLSYLKQNVQREQTSSSRSRKERCDNADLGLEKLCTALCAAWISKLNTQTRT